MKKAPLSPKHQARRARALERFCIKPFIKGLSDKAEYDAYVARKEAERQSLVARLGGRASGF